MTKLLLAAVLLATLAIGDRVWAQTAAPAPVPTLEPVPRGPGPMGRGKMMGPGMRKGGGPGRGGPGGGMGMCSTMIDASDRIEVKNTDKGVTMTFTASDETAVQRLQKMAEAMRLMHEAMKP